MERRKKENFWYFGLSWGPQRVSLPKRLAFVASLRGFGDTLEGLALGLVASVAMVIERESQDSVEMSLPGRETFEASALRLDLCHQVLPGSLCCFFAVPEAIWWWLGRAGYLVHTSVQKLLAFEGSTQGGGVGGVGVGEAEGCE